MQVSFNFPQLLSKGFPPQSRSGVPHASVLLALDNAWRWHLHGHLHLGHPTKEKKKLLAGDPTTRSTALSLLDVAFKVRAGVLRCAISLASSSAILPSHEGSPLHQEELIASGTY